jgi:hypothetical protein
LKRPDTSTIGICVARGRAKHALRLRDTLIACQDSEYVSVLLRFVVPSDIYTFRLSPSLLRLQLEGLECVNYVPIFILLSHSSYKSCVFVSEIKRLDVSGRCGSM